MDWYPGKLVRRLRSGYQESGLPPIDPYVRRVVETAIFNLGEASTNLTSAAQFQEMASSSPADEARVDIYNGARDQVKTIQRMLQESL